MLLINSLLTFINYLLMYEFYICYLIWVANIFIIYFVLFAWIIKQLNFGVPVTNHKYILIPFLTIATNNIIFNDPFTKDPLSFRTKWNGMSTPVTIGNQCCNVSYLFWFYFHVFQLYLINHILIFGSVKPNIVWGVIEINCKNFWWHINFA